MPDPDNSQFLATLPEDVRAEPSLKSVPDVSTLAKNYVNAQKLIGTKRIAAPDPNWGESQWNEFYDQVGRPKTHDQYQVPSVQLEEGISLDKDKIGKFQQHLHKLGLTTKQASGIFEYYLSSLNETARGQKSISEQQAAASETELKNEWGEKFSANLDLAKGVIRKFGDEKFMQYIEGSGMGNNPQLVKMLSKIGSMMLEDKALGSGSEFGLKDGTRAVAEIESLKTDKEFMEALMKHEHTGHRAAAEKWVRLHQVAYPGKQGDAG